MDKQSNLRTNIGLYLVLHLNLLVSSLSGVCSKMASRQDSITGFVFWYFCVLLTMGVYAVVWQQLLKRIPLTVAYANRPINLMWGMVWGFLFFQEQITWNMLLGAAIIFAGIYLVISEG